MGRMAGHSGPDRIEAAEAQVDFVDLRRKAVSMAVMLQVRLAHQHYHLVKRQYLVNRNLDEINAELNEQLIQETVAGRTDELTAIRSATNSMVARLRHYQAYAEMQNAVGRLFNSLGLDPLSGDIGSANLSLVAETLDASFTRWDKLVNYLGEQADGQGERDDAGIADLLASFDRGLHLSDATSTRTGDSYQYDWLDNSFMSRQESSIGQKDVEGGGTKVTMKGGKVADRSVLYPVDESLYAPKKISLVSRGVPVTGNSLYYPSESEVTDGVSKGVGNVGFLSRVADPSARARGRYPMGSRGYNIEIMDKNVALEKMPSSQILLTGKDEKK